MEGVWLLQNRKRVNATVICRVRLEGLNDVRERFFERVEIASGVRENQRHYHHAGWETL